MGYRVNLYYLPSGLNTEGLVTPRTRRSVRPQNSPKNLGYHPLDVPGKLGEKQLEALSEVSRMRSSTALLLQQTASASSEPWVSFLTSQVTQSELSSQVWNLILESDNHIILEITPSRSRNLPN